MTTEQKIIKTKVGVLELAKQLGNVARACRIMGYSLSFYRFKELYETTAQPLDPLDLKRAVGNLMRFIRLILTVYRHF